jgi:hypothetical protein
LFTVTLGKLNVGDGVIVRVGVRVGVDEMVGVEDSVGVGVKVDVDVGIEVSEAVRLGVSVPVGVVRKGMEMAGCLEIAGPHPARIIRDRAMGRKRRLRLGFDGKGIPFK